MVSRTGKLQTLAHQYIAHETRVSRVNARENPVQPKTRAKVRSKVIRFL